MVGISQPAVSDLMSRGVIAAGGTAGEWLRMYCAHLREVAAGRASMDGGGLDLVQERAALAREQREGQAIKNAIARREYAPIDLLTRVLSAACAAVVERLDGLSPRLRKEVPDLPPDAYDAIASVIASARNEWVRAAHASMMRHDDDGDEMEDVEA